MGIFSEPIDKEFNDRLEEKKKDFFSKPFPSIQDLTHKQQKKVKYFIEHGHSERYAILRVLHLPTNL